jgi:spore coat polysaccharide biosynthesis protein SpsF
MVLSNNLLIVQARMSSTRFPGKVLKNLEESLMIDYQLLRISKCKFVQKTVVATSEEITDDVLVEHLSHNAIDVVRGSLNDVLDRFIKVLDIYRPDYFIRITGDCPLVMPEIIDCMVDEFEKSSLDYLSNALEPSYPDGLDVEIIKTSALRKLNTMALSSTEREHVTLGIYSRPGIFNVRNLKNETDLSMERWTVDYPEDLEFIRKIVRFENTCSELLTFPQVLEYLREHPETHNKLSGSLRNEALKDWVHKNE